MEGHQQLPSTDVQLGRSIASLRIYVERAIGRIKQFAILQGTFPLSMIRLVNQIVCIFILDTSSNKLQQNRLKMLIITSCHWRIAVQTVSVIVVMKKNNVI